MFVQSYKHTHTLIQTLFVKHILNNEELYTNTTTDNQTWFVQTPFVANFFWRPHTIKHQTSNMRLRKPCLKCVGVFFCLTKCLEVFYQVEKHDHKHEQIMFAQTMFDSLWWCLKQSWFAQRFALSFCQTQKFKIIINKILLSSIDIMIYIVQCIKISYLIMYQGTKYIHHCSEILNNSLFFSFFLSCLMFDVWQWVPSSNIKHVWW